MSVARRITPAGRQVRLTTTPACLTAARPLTNRLRPLWTARCRMVVNRLPRTLVRRLSMVLAPAFTSKRHQNAAYPAQSRWPTVRLSRLTSNRTLPPTNLSVLLTINRHRRIPVLPLLTGSSRRCRCRPTTRRVHRQWSTPASSISVRCRRSLATLSRCCRQRRRPAWCHRRPHQGTGSLSARHHVVVFSDRPASNLQLNWRHSLARDLTLVRMWLPVFFAKLTSTYRYLCAATEALCFCFVRRVFCRLLNIFLSLHKDTERISIAIIFSYLVYLSFFLPPQPMLQRRHICFRLVPPGFCLSRFLPRGFCPVPSVFLPLRKSERISVKFVRTKLPPTG